MGFLSALAEIGGAAFWAALLAKMLASAAIVVLASMAVERTGPLVGAMIATLPVSAGPAYVFLAIDHDAGFLRDSAVASLPAIAATALFIAAYAGMARRHGVALSLAVALAIWLAAALFLGHLVGGLAGTGLATILVVLGCVGACRRLRKSGPLPTRPKRASDVWVRAGIVMALVVAVVLAGRLAGPGAAGILAFAPVVMVSLAVILHPRIGGAAIATVLVLSLPGLLGFVAALFALALTVERLGPAPALSLALLINLGWNGGILLASRRRSARSLAPSLETD
ncbi:hypothetical protein [Methylobacterium frigidaeris]|uniref:Uncharacterized protein n=1 Tax=Methylobacterium frigidaeris TaxID=2038277 RepID=A0AA37M2W4_9HYPH|nr:hypothetical protein [Methylobacterium frigidaeris]PIK69414.1 hypothetical protein CS379_30000 [Methylobacterium frigidaeris]GJD60054.1 hypothetical protein MPEAHAMD_0187 [Methylobacterium frigidaeris]